jgi:transposase-like protein
MWTQDKPLATLTPEPFAIYILDGVYLSGRENATLICRTMTGQLAWDFTQRETLKSWADFLGTLPEPRAVVIDGQKGLLAAVQCQYPSVLVQRCIVHIERLARIKLTRHPKTAAGRKLLSLVQQIFNVRTKRQRRRWLRAYRHWEKQYAGFLKQRSEGKSTENRDEPAKHGDKPTICRKRTWWYTHRNLRAVRSLIRNALPHLFTFVRHPQIPRTTNHVEGGINSRLKELIHRHRGLSQDQKQVLVTQHLTLKNKQKPPRNVT